MVKDKCSKKKRLATMIQHTICVTGAVAVVVFIERQEAWEAATAFWPENEGDEGKGAWLV